MKKISIIVATGLCLITLLLLAFFQNTVPREFGKKDFPALDKTVEVTFDDFGIPHINAQTDLDGYRVLGYVVASERLFQLDLMRRIVNGRLSEIFGEKAIESDKVLRKLHLKETGLVHQAFIEADPKNAKVIEFAKAYLEGIHYYIDTAPLPLDFILLNYVPEKFELSDVLAVPGYMALTFAEGIIGDVFLSEMIDKLPDDKMKILRAKEDVDLPLPSNDLIPEETTSVIRKFIEGIDGISDIFPLFHGSNSWILSGDRTESGFPILGNDPHIAVGAPHIFFEAHLKTPGIEIYGNYIPLVPFPVMGHTPESAWGITMSEVDDLNIYLEKVDPQDPTKIMLNNEWTDLEIKTEFIKVKNGNDIEIEKAYTAHGPVINDTNLGVEGKTLSLNWSVYHPESNILKSLYDISQAITVDDFKEAVSIVAAPGLNMSWVNRDGDIVWWMLGKYPKLPDGVATDLVLNGWDGSAEVERYYSIDENPHSVNPENGVIVTANYSPISEDYQHFSGYWQPGGRYFRISELLSEKHKWNLEQLKRVQTDSIVPKSDFLLPQLMNTVDLSSLTDFEKKALEKLKTWDRGTEVDSVGSTINASFTYFLISNAFRDELGDKGFENFGRTTYFWYAYKRLLKDLKHSFWDNVKTNRVESGEEIIIISFKEAIKDLRGKLGSRIDLWNWGKVHTVEHEHPIGKVSPLNYLYNIGPVAANGGRYVINNQGHKKHLNDFRVVHGPATRRLVDMSDPKNSLGILPSGNSGNPFSEHYRDQIELFQAGKYRNQLMDWDIIEKSDSLIFNSK